jgi:hypothetical protein
MEGKSCDMSKQTYQPPRIPREFFINDHLNMLPPMARLLFLGLLHLGGESATVEDNPRRIKAEIFPYEADVNMDALLAVLYIAGLITRSKDDEELANMPQDFIYIENPQSWSCRDKGLEDEA